MTKVTSAPYIDGKGPTLVIDLANGTMESGEELVFMWDVDTVRYGLSIESVYQEARFILDFVLAYVERPEEFDRSKDEHTEQEHADFWERHGEAFGVDLDNQHDDTIARINTEAKSEILRAFTELNRVLQARLHPDSYKQHGYQEAMEELGALIREPGDAYQ